MKFKFLNHRYNKEDLEYLFEVYWAFYKPFKTAKISRNNAFLVDYLKSGSIAKTAKKHKISIGVACLIIGKAVRIGRYYSKVSPNFCIMPIIEFRNKTLDSITPSFTHDRMAMDLMM